MNPPRASESTGKSANERRLARTQVPGKSIHLPQPGIFPQLLSNLFGLRHRPADHHGHREPMLHEGLPRGKRRPPMTNDLIRLTKLPRPQFSIFRAPSPG